MTTATTAVNDNNDIFNKEPDQISKRLLTVVNLLYHIVSCRTFYTVSFVSYNIATVLSTGKTYAR